MFGPPRPIPNMYWNNYRPPPHPQWRHPVRPRAPYRGQFQHFDQRRPPFLPGSDNYWCETCDRGFPTEEFLNKHKQQHEKCNIDGCQFIAHPKVVTKHIQMQHSTGLYKKIANLHKPEEIEKWRAERKMRYPTKANIEKKAAELQEKINRGEKMGLHRNRHSQSKDNAGYNKDNMTGEGFKRNHGTAFGNQQRANFQRKNIDKNHNKKPKPAPKALPTVEDNRKLKPFAGILNIKMDSDDEVEEVLESNDIEIEDEEFVESENVKAETTIAEPVVCGALSSLMFDYGSSEDEKDNEIVTNDTNNVKTEPTKSDINKEEILLIVQKSNVDTPPASEESLEIAHVRTKSSSLDASFSPKESCNELNVRDSNVEQNCISTQAIGVKTNISDTTQITPGIKKTIISNVSFKSNEDNQTFKDSVDDPNQSTVEIKDLGVDKDMSISKNVEDDDSGPEEVSVVKNEELSFKTETIKPKNIIRKKTLTGKQIFKRPKRKLPSTLLHKLLFKEMKQERNRVLQCIRYITKSNYFENKK